MRQNDDNDDVAALAARVAALEEINAALAQRVADLEALHAPSLAEIRTQRAAADPEAQRQRAETKGRDRARCDSLLILEKATNDVRFPLGALRKVLRWGRFVMGSDASPVREALPKLVAAIERVLALVGDEPWPESVEPLQEAERFREDATAALAEFDQRWAEQEAARRPAATAER
jgi:hypothetical protein